MRVEELNESPRESYSQHLGRNHRISLLVFTSVKFEELFVLLLNSLLKHDEEPDVQPNVENEDEYDHDGIFNSTKLEC